MTRLEGFLRSLKGGIRILRLIIKREGEIELSESDIMSLLFEYLPALIIVSWVFVIFRNGWIEWKYKAEARFYEEELAKDLRKEKVLGNPPSVRIVPEPKAPPLQRPSAPEAGKVCAYCGSRFEGKAKCSSCGASSWK